MYKKTKKLAASIAVLVMVAIPAACSDSGSGADTEHDAQASPSEAERDGDGTGEDASVSKSKPEPTHSNDSTERIDDPATKTTKREPVRDCTTITAEDALHEAVAKMSPYRDHLPDYVWSDDFYPDYHAQSFDSCAALTGMPVAIEGATGSSPIQVALFHQGEYLGTATGDAYTNPKVDQLADDTVQVTWSYRDDTEAAASEMSQKTARFTWNAAQDKVVMTGDVPPAR